MSRTVSFACASALLLAFAAPAVAQQQFSQDRVVTTAGVDVNTRGGADIVLDRIENTAESICGDRPGPMQLQERTDVANCTYETTEIAVNDSGIPMLHQRYYGYEPQIIIEDDLSTKGSK